jgi:alpha-tubulin suppressor-like RCC1 family protein
MKNNFTKIIASLFLCHFAWCSINAQHVGAGGWHSVVVCNDGTVKTFGENASGQLGNGQTTDSNLPVSVSGLTNVVAVSAGGDQLEAHTMALKSDGTVWCWGSNIYGGLGNGTTTSTTTPVQTLLVNNVTAISAGGWHSTALRNDGTVWCWGWNIDGQIGDGTTTDRVIATQVSGLNNVIQIAAGTYHNLALKNDGTVWAWGDNVSGQIGDGTTTDRTTPVQVSGLNNVVKIAAGRFFSLAVKSDGTVWTWGENLYGQLGNGTTTNSSVPVQVAGITGATTVVACGAFHCILMLSDNTLVAWGRNTYGNLGDNTVTHKSVPVPVLNINNAVDMAAGTNFTLIVRNDGTLWGCGRNASGQLGDGTFLQRNTVVQATSLCPVMMPVGIDDEFADNDEYHVYPNPTNGIINIQAKNNYSLTIYDITGKQMLSYQPTNGLNSTFDISNLPNGVYYLKLQSDNYYQTKKIIKQ